MSSSSETTRQVELDEFLRTIVITAIFFAMVASWMHEVFLYMDIRKHWKNLTIMYLTVGWFAKLLIVSGFFGNAICASFPVTPMYAAAVVIIIVTYFLNYMGDVCLWYCVHKFAMNGLGATAFVGATVSSFSITIPLFYGLARVWLVMGLSFPYVMWRFASAWYIFVKYWSQPSSDEKRPISQAEGGGEP